jgi:hypothetical protein
LGYAVDNEAYAAGTDNPSFGEVLMGTSGPRVGESFLYLTTLALELRSVPQRLLPIFGGWSQWKGLAGHEIEPEIQTDALTSRAA